MLNHRLYSKWDCYHSFRNSIIHEHTRRWKTSEKEKQDNWTNFRKIIRMMWKLADEDLNKFFNLFNKLERERTYFWKGYYQSKVVNKYWERFGTRTQKELTGGYKKSLAWTRKWERDVKTHKQKQALSAEKARVHKAYNQSETRQEKEFHKRKGRWSEARKKSVRH